MTDQEIFQVCIERIAECLDKLSDVDDIDPDIVDQALYATVVADIEDENLCPGCARIRIATLREHLSRIEAGLPPNAHRH
jgi:hypothetical protein